MLTLNDNFEQDLFLYFYIFSLRINCFKYQRKLSNNLDKRQGMKNKGEDTARLH